LPDTGDSSPNKTAGEEAAALQKYLQKALDEAQVSEVLKKSVRHLLMNMVKETLNCLVNPLNMCICNMVKISSCCLLNLTGN